MHAADTPSPAAPHGTARGGRTELPVGRSHGRALLAPTQGLSLHHPAGAQPGWQGAGSPSVQQPPSPGSPRATFVWEPPGRREQGPAGQRLHPNTARIHGSNGTRAARGQVLPQRSQQNGHSGQGAGGCPGQTWAARAASGTRRFPAGTSTHNAGLVVSQMRRTRCSHAAPRGCLSPGTRRGAVAQHGRGHLDVPRGAAPKLPALRSTSVSRHALLPARPAARRNQGQPSVLAPRRAAKEPSQRREVTGAMPGAVEELGFVPIAANTSQGWWSPGFPTHTSHGSHLPLPSPQLPASPSPPAQAAESGPGAAPASSQRHHPHLAGACCARESGRETSGPAGCFPGRAAKAPFAVASALGRAPQSAGGCSSFLIPALEIIYLLKNSFPWEACSNAEGNLQLQGKNKQFEPWRPRCSANTGAKPRASASSCAGSAQESGGVPPERGSEHPPVVPRQRRAGGGQSPRCQQCCRVPTKAAQPWGARGVPFAGALPPLPAQARAAPQVLLCVPPPPPSTAGTGRGAGSAPAHLP